MGFVKPLSIQPRKADLINSLNMVSSMLAIQYIMIAVSKLPEGWTCCNSKQIIHHTSAFQIIFVDIHQHHHIKNPSSKFQLILTQTN